MTMSGVGPAAAHEIGGAAPTARQCAIHLALLCGVDGFPTTPYATRLMSRADTRAAIRLQRQIRRNVRVPIQRTTPASLAPAFVHTRLVGRRRVVAPASAGNGHPPVPCPWDHKLAFCCVEKAPSGRALHVPDACHNSAGQLQRRPPSLPFVRGSRRVRTASDKASSSAAVAQLPAPSASRTKLRLGPASSRPPRAKHHAPP